MPFFDPAFPLFGQLPKYRTEISLQVAYSTFRRYFGMKTTWYLHSHLV